MASTLLGLGIGLAGMAWLVFLTGMPIWRAALVGAIFAGVALLVWGTKRHVKRRMESPSGERWRTLMYQPWVRVGLAFSAVPLFVVWMVGFSALVGNGSGSVLVEILSNLQMGVMFFGAMLISLAFVRGGKEPRCAGCQYLLEGAPEGGYDVCPECGHNLRGVDAITEGHKTVIKPMIVVGVVLIIGSIASIGRLSRGSGGHLPYLPTGSLIKEVTAAPRGFTSDEWTELLTRSLTPKETETLFGGMLDLRDTKGYLAREAEGWLDRTAMAGAVPPDMVERYYEGMLALWLAGPDVVRRSDSGDPRFGFGGDYRGNIHVPANSVLRVFFVPESLTVDGARADMVNDPRMPIHGISLNTTDRSFRGIERNEATPASRGPTAQINPIEHDSDVIELRGTGWVYIAPDGTPAPTGGAITPPGAVWLKRIDLRKTVKIED